MTLLSSAKHSLSISEHLDHLEHIFQCLEHSGISLKLSKCVFASEKGDLLGFELSDIGIRPQSRLTDVIRTFSRPTTRKELKSFLGLASTDHLFRTLQILINLSITCLATVYHSTISSDRRSDHEFYLKIIIQDILNIPITFINASVVAAMGEG